jgi:hypothetical protein
MVLLLESDLISSSLAIDERGGHKDLHGLDRRSIIPYINKRTELYCSSMPCLTMCPLLIGLDRPSNLHEVTHVRTFYSSRSDSYNES